MTLDLTDIHDTSELEGYEHPGPGVYHVTITGAVDRPEIKKGSKAGEISDSVVVEFECLAGTNADGIGKSFSHYFAHPSPHHKDGGKMATKQLARLLIASGAITAAQLGTAIDPEWETWLPGRHLIIEVEENEYQGRKSARVKSMKMWRLDDPAVASVPKHNKLAESYLASPGSGPAIGGSDSGAAGAAAKTLPPNGNGSGGAAADPYAGL